MPPVLIITKMNPGKCAYNLKEDTLMIEIVKNFNEKNPNNLSFWIKAKRAFEGLERHSGESLRKHWGYLIEKKKIIELNPWIKINKNTSSRYKKSTNPCSRIAKQKQKDEMEVAGYKKPPNPCKKICKQEFNFKVESDENMRQDLNCEVKVEEGKMTYSDWVSSEQNCDEFPKKGFGSEEICKFFNTLIEACNQRAGFNVEPELVVRVLDMYGGATEKTIKYFEHKYHYIS